MESRQKNPRLVKLLDSPHEAVDSSSPLRNHPGAYYEAPDVTQSLPVIKYGKPQLQTSHEAVDSLSPLRTHPEVIDVTQSLPIIKQGRDPQLRSAQKPVASSLILRSFQEITGVHEVHNVTQSPPIINYGQPLSPQLNYNVNVPIIESELNDNGSDKNSLVIVKPEEDTTNDATPECVITKWVPPSSTQTGCDWEMMTREIPSENFDVSNGGTRVDNLSTNSNSREGRHVLVVTPSLTFNQSRATGTTTSLSSSGSITLKEGTDKTYNMFNCVL